MQIKLIRYLIIIFLAPLAYAEDSLQDLKVEHFQVKVKPNSFIPKGNVYSDHPSKTRYNRSRSSNLSYQVEVRGRCKNSSAKLTAFRLELNNQTVLDIPVSGNNRSLTDNGGKKWEAHTVNINLAADRQNLIEACQSLAAQQVQSQSHDQVFNSNFTTSNFYSGQDLEVYYHCEGGAFFDDPVYDTTALPIKALCEATGYQSILQVTSSQLNLNPIAGQDGTCKLNIDGSFQTGYELYSLRSDLSTAQLKYRFKYTNGTNVAYSQWWEKTANPVNGGAFLFDYTDRLPTGITGGKVSLEVDTNGAVYKSKAKPFSIDCVNALPLQQTQTLDLALSVSADKSETVAIGGQLCPTHAIIMGGVRAGYPINGKMIILGSSLADLYVKSINLSAGQRATQEKRVKLNWSSATSTLALNNSTPSNTLKTQTLNYGLRVTNSSNEVVKSLAKKPYVISCEYPSVNPSLPGSDTLNMSPNHTGGGAPTSLTGQGQVNHQLGDNKTIDAGLRSDGELVQAKKPKKLLGHELSHTQQQGRVLTDSDYNEQQSQNVPPAPVPAPYPTIGTKPKDAEKLKVNPKDIVVKSWSTSGDADDRPTSNKSDRVITQKNEEKKYTVPLQNATVSSIKSKQLNNTNRTKPTLFKGKLGEPCQWSRFPKNAVIKQSGRQVVVECIKGKALVNKKKKVQQQWRTGDPVFPLPSKK